jgi:DNA polymerase-3 subunit gamma/tau
MATLYRKYRPQNFIEVVGQNHIKLTLEHEIEAGKLAHAYLFCGPRAVGKTTLARVLTKAINCTNRKEGEHEPCGVCDSCREITEGRGLDIMEIDAASHTGVDNVRENIIAQARVSPAKSKYKVFIIDEVHMLSASAFNALLKVIEEPPAFVVFILCTTEIHKVPATIISRCQRFDFKRISISDITKKLIYIAKEEKIKIDKEILEAVARQSEGHMRDAESLMGQLVSIGGQEITREEADLVIPRSDLTEAVNLIEYLGAKDAASGLALANKLIDQGVDLKVFLSDTIEILRKMVFAKISPALSEKLALDFGENLELKINEAGKNLNSDNLLLFISEFMKARNELKNSFIIQLPLEIAIVKICSGYSGASQPEEIISRSPFGGNARSASAQTFSKTANTEPRASSANVGGNADLKEIMDKWNEVLARVKKYNHSLSFILRVCQPRNLNNNRLCLAFKYKFHKDRVNDEKIRTIIEKVLNEVYSMPLTIEAVIDEGLEVGNENLPPEIAMQAEAVGEDKEESGAKEGDAISNLLKTFGGKVIK